MYGRMYVCMHACVHVCMYVCMYVRARVQANKSITKTKVPPRSDLEIRLRPRAVCWCFLVHGFCLSPPHPRHGRSPDEPLAARLKWLPSMVPGGLLSAPAQACALQAIGCNTVGMLVPHAYDQHHVGSWLPYHYTCSCS